MLTKKPCSKNDPNGIQINVARSLRFSHRGSQQTKICHLKCDKESQNIFQYMFDKMQLYTVYLYLETALHVSGVTSTHYQERMQLYLQHPVFVTPLLLSAAIVDELELLFSSNSSTIAAGSNNGVTSTTCCTYSCMRS